MMIEMKKKFIAVICVIALTLSLPMLAWGADSPAHEQAVSGDVVLDVSVGPNSTGTLGPVVATEAQASNVVVTADDEVLASFEITGDATDVNLVFSVGTQWAGYTCTVFIQHSDGSDPETRTVTIAADGTVAIHVDKLSIFTLVVDKTSAPSAGGPATDNGSTSPKTGVDMGVTTGVIAGLTIAMAIGALCAAVALRKKVIQ
jgi:hypothetical protein